MPDYMKVTYRLQATTANGRQLGCDQLAAISAETSSRPVATDFIRSVYAVASTMNGIGP